MSDKPEEALNKVHGREALAGPRSGRQHKARGGAQRNPRIPNDTKVEPAERAAAQADLLIGLIGQL